KKKNLKKKKKKKIFICYTNMGELIFLDIFGNFIKSEIILEKKPIHCIKIKDLNNNGFQEILIGGFDGILRIFTIKDDLSLELFWIHKFEMSISGIILDDINSDNNLEIIVFSLDRTLRILNVNGELIWAQMFEKGIGDVTIYFDRKSNKKQIFAVGNDGTLRIYDGSSGDLLWFKIFNNKLRCLSIIKTNGRSILACGGDDRKLYLIELDNQEIIKTLAFNNYVWKCKAFPKSSLDNLIVSSYSFEFFNNSKSLADINFTSKIVSINKNIEIKWELTEINSEDFCIFNKNKHILIGIGTTKGDLIIVDENSGNIIFKIELFSCINMVQYISEEDLLIACNDEGKMYAFSL
ncbi:MAG: hypothetical protein JXA99_16335, partial [Candidatus Lokiarchaeota archaeon]|nr:hypothetical protein [Candidatus Lokiarchaeota archaeon]